ncbi:MAG TPA: DUF2358 domain-containing protein [Oscillatoriaceae cyanobacterium M33_DOE_052]|uniref:DUF2358 domain-containing protein n=1 Tax=Planktothricoides sp. SpSt-374 TaxID=2282167 RepID=A0A7C3ZND8_9CYAN|nr:DUF2358 domain-containing protein [Oscillatoriaceae cyanobacterium M33_DOE_052]
MCLAILADSHKRRNAGRGDKNSDRVNGGLRLSLSQISVSQVVKTLQADLPSLFQRDISYDIYTDDIYFQDPVNTFKGKLNYRIIFWTLRFHGRLFFRELHFDLHDIQATDDEIIATWTVRGVLRLPWKTRLLFNGYSTYKLNSESLIYHHVDTWDRPPGEILKQFLPL